MGCYFKEERENRSEKRERRGNKEEWLHTPTYNESKQEKDSGFYRLVRGPCWRKEKKT